MKSFEELTLEELGEGITHWALHEEPASCSYCENIDEALGSPQGDRVGIALRLIPRILRALGEAEQRRLYPRKTGSRRCTLCPTSRMHEEVFHLHELEPGEAFRLEEGSERFILRGISLGRATIEVQGSNTHRYFSPGTAVCRMP